MQRKVQGQERGESSREGYKSNKAYEENGEKSSRERARKAAEKIYREKSSGERV